MPDVRALRPAADVEAGHPFEFTMGNSKWRADTGYGLFKSDGLVISQELALERSRAVHPPTESASIGSSLGAAHVGMAMALCAEMYCCALCGSNQSNMRVVCQSCHL